MKSKIIKSPLCLALFVACAGNFVNRFTAIYPYMGTTVGSNGVNGLLILPIPTMGNYTLIFPVSTNDFLNTFGNEFNVNDFRKTQQFWYMGEDDNNDDVPFADCYSENERERIYRNIDTHMMHHRWKKCSEQYLEKVVMATFKTCPDVGHELTEQNKNDLLRFFADIASGKL